jgi:hypothetical protein
LLMSGSTWRSRSQPTPSPDSRPQGGLGRDLRSISVFMEQAGGFLSGVPSSPFEVIGAWMPTQHAVVCQKSDRDDAHASSARTLSRVSAFRGPHMDERPRPVISYEEERRCSSFCNRRDVWTRRAAVHRHNSRRFDGARETVNACPSALSRRSVPLQSKTPAYLPHRQRVHEVLARPRRNTAHSRQSRLACNTVATIDGGVLFVPGNVVYALHRGWGGRLPRPPGLSFGGAWVEVTLLAWRACRERWLRVRRIGRPAPLKSN